MKINIEIEYLTSDMQMVNFHIRENDALSGQDAVFFFKCLADGLFKSGVDVILANIKKMKSARHIHLFVRQCGMKPASENEQSIIYYLRRKGEV